MPSRTAATSARYGWSACPTPEPSRTAACSAHRSRRQARRGPWPQYVASRRLCCGWNPRLKLCRQAVVKALMNAGVRGDNGMVQAFPPNTGVGWYTMATGTYPGEHGSTNNTFFRSGDAFTNRTSFAASGVLQADTLAAAAERAGKKVAQVQGPARINPRIPR